jgi:(2S)-methylsuccinyl-CoA dehydrogenase
MAARSSERAQAIRANAEVLQRMSLGLAARCESEGRVDRGKLDANQPAAFALARALAEQAAAEAIDAWGRANGPHEEALADVYVARVVRAAAPRARFSAESFGLMPSLARPLEALASWTELATRPAAIDVICGRLTEGGLGARGAYGLAPDHEEIRQLFARFADERVQPEAESIHRDDRVIPEALLRELAELGVFGISIPEKYGGSYIDHLTMCLATEELSRASLGAGGSVITRPEICSKAILKGGTEEQKRAWLPAIARGERIVSVAVTEPNAGSDVASLRVTARSVPGGYEIDGEKTWCTFAGRADVFILLARTGEPSDGAKGLTLFLVEKPAHISETEHHSFKHTQQDGGRVEGHAIPTIGYRGMHSFSVTFESYFVPEDNRIGALGQGFALQMAGFAGGRIQTASRAVGVMEAALCAAVEYAGDRSVFASPLTHYSLVKRTLVEMAAVVQASRQLSYAVAQQMDEGEGADEASLVKLLACKDAEWVTREAMQLHGGMGYSEEYAVSRYWQDARVLSIFEGAEEILAIYVVARAHLRRVLANR